jgi:hypothetical protein
VFGKYLDPENGGEIFLWNVCRLSTDYTVVMSQKTEFLSIIIFIIIIIIICGVGLSP